MKIGDVEIKAATRLAPMAGVTNAPFRLIARECGSGLTTTEEMDAAALLINNPHADAIAAHPRTRSQRFTGKAPWTIIAEVVEAVGIPVTGNGDVRSMAEARRMMTDTGCHSVMIGRGALGGPWIFDESFDALGPETQREYKVRVIARHCDLIRAHFREKYALVQMKKHLAWYTEGLGHARSCRVEIFQAQTVAEVWEVFQRYWERADPPPLDQALGS